MYLLEGHCPPDHNTIARFRKEHLPYAMKDLLDQMVRLLLDCHQTDFVNANHKAVCSMHAFYPTACVSTHAVVLCDMNGRQMPLSPAPTSSSVPLGLISRG